MPASSGGTAADARLARQRLALRSKLASLRNEVDAWTKMPKAPGFAIHTSQIEDVCGGLARLHQLIEKEIDDAEQENMLTAEAIVGFERKSLAALQIWECYRDKLSLRLVPSLREALALVDDLAWEAYRPARDRAHDNGTVDATALREPPLVFPNTRWSPFARSREQRYELDETTGNWDAFADLEEWLRALPVPLIGIPWYQMCHLPDAVFIGHEVGHLVEEDLGLDEALRKAIGDVLPQDGDDAVTKRRIAWTRHWRSEVFADVYGVLTTGPAYARILVDALHGDDVSGEVQPDAARSTGHEWSAYPTRMLRALVVFEAVHLLPDPESTGSFVREASALKTAWVSTYPQHAMAEYEDDVPRVVRAILETPLTAFAPKKGYPAAPLTKVFPFSPNMHKHATEDAANALARRPVLASDTRELFAGVALAFLTDPAKYASVNAQKRFRDRLLKTRDERVRNVVAIKLKTEDRLARQQAVGARLFKKMQA